MAAVTLEPEITFKLVKKPYGKSKIWNFFGLETNENGKCIDKCKAICRTCYSEVRTNGPNTYTLITHLSSRHPDQYNEFKNKQQLQKIQTETHRGTDERHQRPPCNPSNTKNIPKNQNLSKTLNDMPSSITLDDSMKFLLIDAVKEFPQLYTGSTLNLPVRKRRNYAWRRISIALDLSIGTCKVNWKNLRDIYGKEMNKMYNKDGSNTGRKSTWQFFQQLSFLEPYVRNKHGKPKILRPAISKMKRPRARLPSVLLRKIPEKLDPPLISRCENAPVYDTPSGSLHILPSFTATTADGSISAVVSAVKNLQKRLGEHQLSVQQYNFAKPKQEDEEFFFAMSVACRLRKMVPQKRVLAQSEILKRLHQVELEHQ